MKKQKQWYPVYVKFTDEEFIYDEIRGFDPEDALKNAWENWDCATEIKVQDQWKK
jgi:hypothetical protein